MRWQTSQGKHLRSSQPLPPSCWRFGPQVQGSEPPRTRWPPLSHLRTVTSFSAAAPSGPPDWAVDTRVQRSGKTDTDIFTFSLGDNILRMDFSIGKVRRLRLMDGFSSMSSFVSLFSSTFNIKAVLLSVNKPRHPSGIHASAFLLYHTSFFSFIISAKIIESKALSLNVLWHHLQLRELGLYFLCSVACTGRVTLRHFTDPLDWQMVTMTNSVFV